MINNQNQHKQESKPQTIKIEVGFTHFELEKGGERKRSVACLLDILSLLFGSNDLSFNWLSLYLAK